MKQLTTLLVLTLLAGCNLPPPTADDFNQIGQRSGPSSQDMVLERQHQNLLQNEQMRQQQSQPQGSWIYNAYTRQNQYVPPGANYRWDDQNKTWIIQP